MVPNGESGDGDNEGNIIPFPSAGTTDPQQTPKNVAIWLKSKVLIELQVASKKFNNNQLKPEQKDIGDASSKVTRIINSIYQAMELIDDIAEESEQPLMSIWTRLENGKDGILERLNNIGAELINLYEAANLEPVQRIQLNYGQRVQDVKTNFLKVERDLKNLIKHLNNM